MITWVFTGSILSALLAGGGSYIISRKIFRANIKVEIEQAKAKAKAIEYEAEKFLQESKIKAKDIELEAKLYADKQKNKNLKEHEANLLLVEKEMCKIDHERHILSKDRNALFEEQEFQL